MAADSGPPEKKPPLDWREARRLFVEEGLRYGEIALRMGYSRKTVQLRLAQHGVRMPPPVTRTGKWTREIYRRWRFMRQRCHNPNYREYTAYGARGIGICEEWEGFAAFREWALASGFRPGLSLALIDPDLDFSPENCRWQSRGEWVRRGIEEGSRASPPITAFGETKSLKEWAADPRCRVGYLTLRKRLQAGHSPEAALSFPSGRIASIEKRRRPVLSKPSRPPVVIDWKAVEREWLAERETFAAIARRIGVTPATVGVHLGPLKAQVQARERIVPPEHRERLDRVWRGLWSKCQNPADALYPRHGGLGIGVCREWESFDPFCDWASRSGYRPGLHLVRRDQRRDYGPKNCRWLAPELARRQPQFGVKPPRPRWSLTAFGETKGVTAWSVDPRCAVSRSTFMRRLHAGWPLEEALSHPPEHAGPPPEIFVTAFGRTKSLVEWTRDRRCRVQIWGLCDRLARGVPPEIAIATPGHELPADLPRQGGKGRATAVGRSARTPRRRAH